MPLGGLTFDQLEEELSDFNCKFDGDDEFVDKMNSLSHQFHLEADDIINETMAYAKNVKKTDLDVAFLDAFETYYKKKKAPASVSKSRTVLADLKPTGTPRRNVKLDMSAMEIDDDPADVTLPRFDCVNAPPHVTEFVMIESPAGPGWFVNRTDSGKVVAQLGGNVHREKSGKKAPFAVTVKELAAGKKDAYGDPKAAGVLDGMNKRLEAYGEDVRAANVALLGDTPYTSLVREGEAEVFIIGFVMDFDAGGDMSAIELMRDEVEGAVQVTVDVTGLDERCFFPGQMAVFKGVNRTGNLFEASARLTADKQPAAVVRKCTEDAIVWVAAGPFTPPTAASYEPLAEIVQKALNEQPDVLVLIGPLVDRLSRFMETKACTMGDEQMTADALKRVAAKMKGHPTRVLFMPSSARDAAVVPVYPGARLRKEWRGEVVEVVSDPVTLVVGGAEIAITASDIITHLSRAESHTSSNKENTDRMKRVAGHVLEQRSLYPLYPPSLSASLEDVHSACTMNGKQPHVIVAPAMLTAFVKSAYGSVIANPGSACRGPSVGTIMQMRIGLTEIPDQGASNLEKYTHVSITKI